MNKVAKIFSAEDVMLDLDVKSKLALFEAVGKLWEDHHVIDAARVVKSLLEREQLGSTGLGQGVAIPHARIKGLTEPIAIFVRTKEPLAFDSPDTVPVSLFFVFLVPSNANEQHLQMLSEIVEMLADNKFREHLKSCKKPHHIHEIFVKGE
jgi:PTS system nitrogen regulatory IIA component